MQRNLAAIDGRSFDIVIAGGGAVGAALARDAARRGFSVALMERDDFASGASGAMPTVIEGGFHDMLSGRIGEVRKAIAERAIWRRTAPHQVVQQSFLVPVPGRELSRQAATRLAAMTYRALGGDRSLAGPTWLDGGEATAAETLLDGRDVAGAAMFCDYRIDEPERLVLAMLLDAAAHGAVIANHCELSGLSYRDRAVDGIIARDRLGGDAIRCAAKIVVNATGIDAATLASALLPRQAAASLTTATAFQIVVPGLTKQHGLAFNSGASHARIVPWKGFSVVAATGEGPSPEAMLGDIDRLCAGISVGDPLAILAGTYAVPTDPRHRHGFVAEHGEDNARNLYSVYGADFAEVRRLAERTVDRFTTVLGSKARSDTATALLPGTPTEGTAALDATWAKKLPSWPKDERAHWLAAYGSGITGVFSRTVLADRLDAASREKLRFTHALSVEMAVTADDILRRIGRWSTLADPGLAVRAAAFVAAQDSKGRLRA